MVRSKRTISPLLYYILISTFIQLTLLLAAVGVFALLSIHVSLSALVIIGFLILWKSGIVGMAACFWFKKVVQQGGLVSFIGFYLGRFWGAITGGFLGAKISKALSINVFIGAVVGFIAFYFVGRWVGSKLSGFYDRQLSKVFSLPEIMNQEPTKMEVITRRGKIVGILLFGIIFPLLFVDVGFMMLKDEITVGYFPELLPGIRVAAILFSILSIGVPWLLKVRYMEKIKSGYISPETTIFWIGLLFSYVPAVYGLVLFLAASGSVFELVGYSLAASAAVFIWGVTHIE